MQTQTQTETERQTDTDTDRAGSRSERTELGGNHQGSDLAGSIVVIDLGAVGKQCVDDPSMPSAHST